MYIGVVMKIKRTDLYTALILNFMYLLLGFMTGESIFWILLAINAVLLIVPAIYRYEKEKKNIKRN